MPIGESTRRGVLFLNLKNMKRIIFITIAFASVAIGAAINVGLNTQERNKMSSLTLAGIEAMADESITTECKIFYTSVMGANTPVFCKTNVSSLADLKKGCKSHLFDTTDDSGTITKYYYCMKGELYRCMSGMKIYSKSGIQVGSTTIEYVCKE
jgi:hypothetical protein